MAEGDTVRGDVSVREPSGHEVLGALEAVQQEVWGFGERDIVPAAQLRAVQHAGGMVLVAWSDDRPIGFAYGFPARPHDSWEAGVGIHSHMVAVLRSHRGAGVGRRLKWAQRDWCLERGFGWVSWTFDPMQARNAFLNFHHLGARSHEYLVDFYGTMSGELGGGQPSDRLLAFWDLRDREVVRLAERFAAGLRPEPAPAARGSWLLVRSPSGEPEVRRVDPSARILKAAVPEDATRLFAEEPGRALRWRLAIRQALLPSIDEGFVVTGFDGVAYVLERGPGETSRMIRKKKS